MIQKYSDVWKNCGGSNYHTSNTFSRVRLGNVDAETMSSQESEPEFKIQKEIDKLEKEMVEDPGKLEIQQTFTGVKLSKKSLIRRRLEETRNYKEAMRHGRDILLHHGRHTLTDDVNDLFKPFEEATFAQLSDLKKIYGN